MNNKQIITKNIIEMEIISFFCEKTDLQLDYFLTESLLLLLLLLLKSYILISIINFEKPTQYCNHFLNYYLTLH